MSERVNECPKCASRFLKVLRVVRPHGMNDVVELQCDICNHVWEGLEASEQYKQDRRRGWII